MLLPVLLLACSSSKSSGEPTSGDVAPRGAGAANAPSDAGVADGSTASDGAFSWDVGNCAPQQTLDGFSPVSVPPLIAHVCSTQQIHDFVHSCFGTDTSYCSTWTSDPANAACFDQCLVSPYGPPPAEGAIPTPAAAWGPIVDTANPGKATWFNLGACIALADPSQAACAEQVSARFQCEIAACNATCSLPPSVPASDGGPTEASYTFDFQQCTSSADYNACQMYTAQVSSSCTVSSPDAGPAFFCYALASGKGSEDAIVQLITQQCGM